MERDPWSLIECGRFEEALAAYKVSPSEQPQLKYASLNGQVTALLAMGKAEEALKAAEIADAFAQSMKPAGHRRLLRCAQIRWLLGDRTGARATAMSNLKLIRAGKIKYATSIGALTDALFLFFIGASLKDTNCSTAAINYLTAVSKRQHGALPNAILVKGVLGMETLESVLQAWLGISSLKRAVARCDGDPHARRVLPEILFYVAAGERDRGSEDRCQELLAVCSTLPNPFIVTEWYLAGYERQLAQHQTA